jgi:hypothetical protein
MGAVIIEVEERHARAIVIRIDGANTTCGPTAVQVRREALIGKRGVGPDLTADCIALGGDIATNAIE